ncbi:MAG TPA: hypothetical protein VJO34_15685 [Methylomirabilota bacterium]|nr:hypothetical protein [Methylomirabilota bacterium]
MDKKTVQKRAPILSDHQRVGKRFIPPFLQLGGLEDINWFDVLPELFWLGLLNVRYSLAQGAELAIATSKAAQSAVGESSRQWFALSSAYGALSNDEQRKIVASLKSSGHLEALKEALLPLVAFYPECPLGFFFEESPLNQDPASLEYVKRTLERLLDRRDKEATLAQASAIYIAFVAGWLKVFEGLALANFPAVAQFPDTEESIRVASSVRAATYALLGTNAGFREEQAVWPRYFWNRGLYLEPCTLRNSEDERTE